MNRCLFEGYLPRDWAQSEIFVLFKGSGRQDDPNSYRGISLTNDFYRIFERLLDSRLQSWYKETNIFSDMQFGFCQSKGTTEAYFVFQALIQGLRSTFQNCDVFCAFVDLRKAFPSLKRTVALDLLVCEGCPMPLVRAVAASFSFNSGRLRIDQFLSGSFSINRGTREGGITSPGIFNAVYGAILTRCGLAPPPSIVQAESLSASSVYGIA